MRLGSLTFKVSPLENVYSYFLFAVPLEEAKDPGKWTWTKILAYTLVLFSLFLQGILLYTIFEKVVNGDARWRQSILNPRGESLAGSNLNPYAAPKSACNDGGSLCLKQNGTYTCAPPSVQLTGRWSELDLNGDGQWTRAEAIAAQDDLKCKFAVDPVEVFDVFIKFLLKRENIIWLHPEVRDFTAIRKTYFTYAAGDLIMCSYRNADMCANLLQRGVFDTALKYGTVPRVGTTIDSALAYCYDLLEEGGTCERTLPSTYSVWKKASVDQCKGPDYGKFVFTHPINKKTKSMLAVDYDAVQAYDRAGQLNLFVVFKTIIIGIYLLAMLGEFKEICTLMQWVKHFPESPPETVSSGATQDEENGTTILAVSKTHRITMSILTVFRFFMLFILTWIGIMFLLKDTDYIDLLLNALGLIVVVEITQNVYTFLVSPELREECEACESMSVTATGPDFLNRRPGLSDLIVLAVFIVGVIGVMVTNHTLIVKPLTESLACACLSQGEHCYEANKFSLNFWNQYWGVDTPRVFEELDQLKATLTFEQLQTDDDLNLSVLNVPETYVASAASPQSVPSASVLLEKSEKAANHPGGKESTRHRKRHREDHQRYVLDQG